MSGGIGLFREYVKDRRKLVLDGMNFITETMPYCTTATNTAHSSGRLIGVMVGLFEGDVITNMICGVGTGGSSLTVVKLGLCSLDGTNLAKTADVKDDFTTTGIKVKPLTAAYTVTTRGAYYLQYLSAHSGGATPNTISGSVSANATGPITGGSAFFVFQTGQSDIPASASWTTSGLSAMPWIAVN